jgi:predicted O-methyltransferase YrrM
VDLKILNYLRKLKEYGQANSIPNVTDHVGRFLNMLVTVQRPKTILEVGCANGYSTIWMAEAAQRAGAKIVALDHSAPSFDQAVENLEETGLKGVVDFYFGDVREMIPLLPEEFQFDFVFVDCQKKTYLEVWNLIQDRLTAHAVIVFDDMMAFKEKTKPLAEQLLKEKDYDQLLIPLDGDDGILLLTKRSTDE